MLGGRPTKLRIHCATVLKSVRYYMYIEREEGGLNDLNDQDLSAIAIWIELSQQNVEQRDLTSPRTDTSAFDSSASDSSEVASRRRRQGGVLLLLHVLLRLLTTC